MAFGTESPPKLVITNLRSGAEVVAQFNPTELEEKIGASYARLKVQGAGHTRMHFENTENFEITLELYFKANIEQEQIELLRARRQMLSWAYPRKVNENSAGGGAPTLLMTWPGMLSVEVKMTSCRIKHTRFDTEGRALAFTATVTFEEDRSTTLTDDLVAEDVPLRFGGLSGSN